MPRPAFNAAAASFIRKDRSATGFTLPKSDIDSVMTRRITHPDCRNLIQRLIARALLVVLTAGLALPSPAGGLTVKEEEELGREVLQIVKAQFELIDDPVIVDYVNHIGDKIVNTLPTQPFTYRFFVIKEDVYNAFATPAGNIFIYSGLIEAMEDESELAGILGHEAAHVYCRHISQSIERSKKTNMATLAGIAAGIFLGAAGAGEAGQALVVGSMAAGQTAALSYSRENEMQADQVGLKYLSEAGYTGEGLITVLKKIRSKRWFGTDQIPTYLMTHPAVEERIAYLDTYLANREPSKPAGVNSTSASKFPYMRARLAALYGDEAAAVRDFKTAVEQQPDDPVAHYGYGLALTRAGRRPLAIEHLKKALARRSFNPEILTALGKAYILDGQYRSPVLLRPDPNGLGRHGGGPGNIQYPVESPAEISAAPLFFGQCLRKTRSAGRRPLPTGASLPRQR